MISVRPARPEDQPAIAALLTAAFASPAEAALVARLHATGAVLAEVVAETGGKIVGHALASRMRAPGDWVALAPVGVAPDWQGQGVGSMAVRGVLDAARAAGATTAVVLGAPAFYARFGFSYATTRGWRSPYPIGFTAALDLSDTTAGAGRQDAGGAPVTLVYPEAFDGLS